MVMAYNQGREMDSRKRMRWTKELGGNLSSTSGSLFSGVDSFLEKHGLIEKTKNHGPKPGYWVWVGGEKME